MSVGDRVIGHEKVAISLSGGVDSSIIAIELSKRSRDVVAFTAHWSDSDKERYNFDARKAHDLSQKLGINIEKVEMIKAINVPSELSNFLTIMEEPNNNPSGVSMLALYSRIHALGIRLALTGDGSDEIFGGYSRYVSTLRVKNLLRLNQQKIISNSYADVRKSNSFFGKALATQISPLSPLSWLRWHWVFSPKELSSILRLNHLDKSLVDLMVSSVANLDTMPQNSSLASLMKRDHEIWLAMESNRKLDRISMRFSIEARSPFQDDRVVHWAKEDFSKSNFRKVSKVELWKSYPELKEFQVRNDKAGFTSPVGHWLRSNPSLVSNCLNFLANDSRFIPSSLDFYREAPHRGNYRELMQLWTLIVLATWFQQ